MRLAANMLVLGAGFAAGRFPGIVVGTSAVATGVVAEALYAGLRVRPVLRERVFPNALGEPLTRARFARFYLPLALTPLLTLVIQPIGALAMSRMPRALPSLAAWPGVYGLAFLLRSLGLAYNEVVVALVGLPGGARCGASRAASRSGHRRCSRSGCCRRAGCSRATPAAARSRSCGSAR